MSGNTAWTTLLGGVVGSQAQGLAGPDSDTDYLEFAAAPSEDFWGLRPPTGKAASRVTSNPDCTVHEVGKACALLLSCNPSMMELLWLPPELYTTIYPGLGRELVELRPVFLSAHAVRSAYFGYAVQQFRRLENRTDGTFSSDVRTRTLKHARHLWRLLQQGYQVYSTGHLDVRLSEDKIQACRQFAERAVVDPVFAREELAAYESGFDTVTTPLPAVPDTATVDGWLRHVRRELLV